MIPIIVTKKTPHFLLSLTYMVVNQNIINFIEQTAPKQPHNNELLTITIEDLQVKRVDIEAGVKVVIENVAGRVDMRTGVSGQLHLGVVGERAVLNALREPQELAESLARLPRRHVRDVPVADIEDSASTVDFSANRSEFVCTGERAVGGFGARYGWVGRGGGEGGDRVRYSAEYEDEDEQGSGSHGGCFVEDGGGRRLGEWD
jgi:hypothetical protein